MPEPQIIPLFDQPLKGKVTALALSNQPQGTLVDSRDIVPRDCKTGRTRPSVRAGFSAFGSLSDAVGFATLGSAYDETGGIQLFAMTASALKKWTGSAWSNVGSITSSASRTIHAASKGKQLFIACNDPYKYMDYDDDDDGNPDWTIADWTASAGTIPPNCRIVSTHGERMVLLADPDNPHVVNFSKNDDPFNWDITGETSATAISIEVDEAATAGIPHNKNCFIIGTKTGMWIVQGNPAAPSAILQKFEFTVGPINSCAWCKGDAGYTYILTHNGLYRMEAGCGSPAIPVSRDIIPDSLIGLNGTSNKAYLVYDERWRFVHIYIEGTSAQRWLFDVDGGGFWPITAPGSSILAAHRWGLADSATASGAIVGTASGVMRLDNAATLGGSDLAYFTMLLRLAPDGQKALINKAHLDLSSNTDDTTGSFTVYGGENATNAAARTNDRKSAPVAISALLANHGNWFPRVGGTFLAFHYAQGLTSKHASIETGSLYALPNGTERG